MVFMIRKCGWHGSRGSWMRVMQILHFEGLKAGMVDQSQHSKITGQNGISTVPLAPECDFSISRTFGSSPQVFGRILSS